MLLGGSCGHVLETMIQQNLNRTRGNIFNLKNMHPNFDCPTSIETHIYTLFESQAKHCRRLAVFSRVAKVCGTTPPCEISRLSIAPIDYVRYPEILWESINLVRELAEDDD
jgi:hypothetical protein